MTATLTAALLALGLSAPAPDEAALKRAEAEARRCLDATVKGEFETVIDLTHPRIIEEGGGREAVLQVVREGMTQIKEQGVEFDSGEVQPASASAEADGTLYVVNPTSLVLKADGSTIKTRSFLLGMSDDGGKTWKFVDGSYGADKIRQMFPEIPASLKLPAPQPPETRRDLD